MVDIFWLISSTIFNMLFIFSCFNMFHSPRSDSYSLNHLKSFPECLQGRLARQVKRANDGN